jgi:hypothetical protein
VGVSLNVLFILQLAQPVLLANLELLERVAGKRWLLSTSQLAPLLGLKSLSGKEFFPLWVHLYQGGAEWGGMSLGMRGRWGKVGEMVRSLMVF